MLKYHLLKKGDTMQVYDKIMYHFHRNDKYKNIWYEGNYINVNNQFNTYFTSLLKNFDLSVDTTDGDRVSFDRIIKFYLEEKEIDKETVKRILEEARGLIKNSVLFKRELALEEYRKEKCPYQISRKHCIWVCEEKQLSFWEDQLKNNELSLYMLSLTGRIFKTSDYFLPDNNLTYYENYLSAKDYWFPKFETKEQEEKVEYLFQGKVKILKKIN